MTARTRLEAPDGGWGILVCVGMGLMFLCGLAGLPSMGLVYADFFKTIGAGTSEVTIITSICFCSLSFAGLFSGALFSRFGLRPVALFGALLFFVGSIFLVFVNSLWEMIFHFGILTSIGFGLMIPACFTTFNNYFVKNRILWMSFTQCIIGLGSVGFPVILYKLLDYYGFRGCLLFLAGVNAHVLLAMLLMQPAKWHMRRVVIEDGEEQKEFIKPEKISPPTAEEENSQACELHRDAHEQSKASVEDLKAHPGGHEFQKRANFHRDEMKMRHLHEMQRHSKFSREDIELRSRRSSSIVSLGNWTGPVVVSDASPEMIIRSRVQSTSSSNGAPPTQVDEPNNQSLWQRTVDFLDLTLLKCPVFDNIVFGISCALYSDITFFTLLPIYLYSLDFSKADTARIVSVSAAADLLSRLFLALASIFIKMPPRYIYLAGAFFTIIARFAFIYVFDFVGVACVTAAMGFFRTWIHVPVPLIFAEYLPKERFAAGYGLYMFLHGIFIFAVGPFVGYLRDATKDYILIFHVLNVFKAFCVVPWIAEIVCVKFRRKERISA